MVPDLPPGANVALPGAALGIVLGGPFDLTALVLGASGTVARSSFGIAASKALVYGCRALAKS